MSDDPASIAALQDTTPDAIGTYWQETLDKFGAKVGDQMAAMGMFMVALEAMRTGMGNEGASELLQELAQGVRNGEPVSVAIDRGTSH